MKSLINQIVAFHRYSFTVHAPWFLVPVTFGFYGFLYISLGFVVSAWGIGPFMFFMFGTPLIGGAIILYRSFMKFVETECRKEYNYD